MTLNNKKTIKINFEYFWKGFKPEDNLFVNLLRKYYFVKISDNPDYVFFSVYRRNTNKLFVKMGKIIKEISPNLYVYLGKLFSKLRNQKILEPTKKDVVKIFYNVEHQKIDMSKCDWAFSYYYEDEINHPRYMRLPEYRWYGGGKDLIKDKNCSSRIKKQKIKFCNFIFSNEVNYRNKFFKELSKYKRVDSPGRCMRNMKPLEKEGHSKLSAEEWTKHKLKFMKQYKFTIAIENHILSGYTDEKIYHAMIAGTIPIYYGNPKVSRDFSTKSFINIGDYKNFDEAIKKIIEIDKNDKLYEDMLKQPWLNNNKLSKYLDDKLLIQRLKKIFGGYENELKK